LFSLTALFLGVSWAPRFRIATDWNSWVSRSRVSLVTFTAATLPAFIISSAVETAAVRFSVAMSSDQPPAGVFLMNSS